MKKRILLLLLIACCSKIFCQIQLDFPTEYIDKESIVNHKILIDTTSLNLEIISSRYDKLYVRHYHDRYKASFYDLDTIALLKDKDGRKGEITFLMCANKEFVIDNPYKPNSVNDFDIYIKSRRNIGDWFLGKNERELEGIVAKLNSFIPNKEICNEKRKLWGSPNISFDPDMDSDGYYSYGYGFEMPSIDGSNSTDHRNNSIQTRIEKCLDSRDEKGVARVTYYVNEKGNVDKVKFDHVEQPRIDVTRKLTNCMLNIKFEPAVYKGKNVKSICNTLIGINTSDKYKIYEDLSKSNKSDKKKVDVPKKLVNVLNGQKVDKSEEIFIYKNKEYEVLAKEDSIKRMKLKDDFEIAIYEFTQHNQPKYVEVNEKPSLYNKNFFNELKEQLVLLFPNESFDESFEFIVEKDGSISTTRIAKETNRKVAGEIWRHLYKDLFYFPGKHNGKIVRVKVFGNVNNN